MIAVGVKALKARLSEYLRMAKSGTLILVTERDEVIAEIRSMQRQPLSQTSLEGRLRSESEKGRLTLASETLQSWRGIKTSIKLKNKNSANLLNLLRGDS